MKLTNFPNASLLVLITQRVNEEEKLLFCLLKPVPDRYPNETVYWYDGVGRKAKPSSLLHDLQICQWLAIGKDQVMNGLFNEIITCKEVDIDGVRLHLQFPEVRAHKMTGKTLSHRSEVVTDQWVINNDRFLPPELFDQDTWDQLSGHSPLQAAGNSIFPVGLFDKGYLYNKLNKQVLAVKEHRTPYLTFRGVRSSSVNGEGSREMIGFYQQQFDTSATYKAFIRNASGDLIGSSDINKVNGRIHIKLSEPVIDGVIEIHRNEEQERANHFSLLQNIQLSVVPAKSFNDVYGRKFLINSKRTKTRSNALNDITWTIAEYLDHATAVQNLTSKFKLIFDYLGPHVLIAAPYFLGTIEAQPNGTKKLSKDQLALINAWIHSSVEYEDQRLTILGCSRITGQAEAADTGRTKFDELMDRYQRVLSQIIIDNKLEPFLKPRSIRFLRGTEFHNRYWFSITHKDGQDHLDKCLIVTNSVGNMDELDVMNVTDENQLAHIRRRFHGLYESADESLSV